MAYFAVKVRHHEFAAFLNKHRDVATLWDVDTNEQFADVSIHGPLTVDELMTELDLRPGDNDFIYVYSDNIDDPQEAWDSVDYNTVPEVKADELDEYIVRSSMGKDWLYFACSPEEGSSDRRMTLLPCDSEEEEGQQDDE
jgi:hypothetical protein